MEEYKDINRIIGKNLSTLRKDKKMTQLELAEKFNYSDKSISKWESGESLPSIEVLYELSKFYGTTLDALASKEPIIVKANSNNIVKDKMFPTKLIITLLAFTAVWLLATVLFVCIQIIYEINLSMIFIWAIPLSCVVLIIFNSIWGKPYILFYILTVLIWTTLLAIHLQLVQYQVWIIYILGIPLQIVVILWAALIQKPSKRQLRKRKEKQEKKEKEIKKENKKEALSQDKNEER